MWSATATSLYIRRRGADVHVWSAVRLCEQGGAGVAAGRWVRRDDGGRSAWRDIQRYLQQQLLLRNLERSVLWRSGNRRLRRFVRLTVGPLEGRSRME